jgi:hypothetical protein
LGSIRLVVVMSAVHLWKASITFIAASLSRNTVPAHALWESRKSSRIFPDAHPCTPVHARPCTKIPQLPQSFSTSGFTHRQEGPTGTFTVVPEVGERKGEAGEKRATATRPASA